MPVKQIPIKRPTHRLRVLAVLKEAGKQGVANYYLAQQQYGGFRFGEYIRQLRVEGWHIKVLRRTQGTFIYILTNPKRKFR